MAGFQSTQIGPITLHTKQMPQFKTRHLSVKLAKPIDRTDVTAVAMLPYLWMDGTMKSPTAKALTRRLEALYGAGMRTSIGKRGDIHVAEINAGIPQDAYFHTDEPLLPAVLRLASELISEPAVEGGAFLPAHVRLEQNQHAERIARLFDDKMSYAAERCLAETYAGTNVGLPRLGFEEDIKKLDGKMLLQTHQHLKNSAAVDIYLTGDLGDLSVVKHDVATAFEHIFGTESQRQALSVSPLERAVAAPSETKSVTEAQAISQGKLNLSYRTGISYRDDIYPALLMASGILGGFPHSKLFQNVREKASLAYYAFSRVDALTGVLSIQTGIDVGKYEEALAIIREQVASLQAGEITDEELEFTRRGIMNQYHQASDQPATVAELDYTAMLSGSKRSVDDLIKAVASVTKTEIVEAAQHLQPDTVYFLTNKGAATNAG